jgi:hypothetical protein
MEMNIVIQTDILTLSQFYSTEIITEDVRSIPHHSCLDRAQNLTSQDLELTKSTTKWGRADCRGHGVLSGCQLGFRGFHGVGPL